MSALRLRDRDAVVTKEGLIFRVFGYSHLPKAYICDLEYAPARLFKSDNPKAPRSRGQHTFYKFYEDEGWTFLQGNFLQYLIFHGTISRKTIGVNYNDVFEVRKPDEKLKRLIERKPEDQLIAATQQVLKFVTHHAVLSVKDFGVFGSMLHDFHHPEFSDIDLVIYGQENTSKLCEALHELYADDSTLLTNEFETDEAMREKRWRFKNLSPREFVWHQRRKLVYALFKDEKSGRTIKTEFEPVKDWKGIVNQQYGSKAKAVQKGWVKMLARITNDNEAPFIPSVYGIEPVKILDGVEDAENASRIVSYMEEFRMQARKIEVVYVEGNLEEVTTSKESFHQITLTYCPRYYEQVLKVTSPN